MTILTAIILILYSCKSPVVDKHIECKISETTDMIEFNKLYSNIDTTNVFKKEISELDNISTGIILFKFTDNLNYVKTTLIKKNSNVFECINGASLTKKTTTLNEKDIDSIEMLIKSIDKMYYFEQCDDYISNNDFFLLIIKNDNEIVTKYLSHGNVFFEKSSVNNNLNSVKEILEITYRNSFN